MKLVALLQARWRATAPREQRWLLAAALLVLCALLWWLAVAPALSTLKVAQRQRAELAAQLQQMQSLQAQAKALQAQPRIALDDARRLLEASLKPLGAGARLAVTGERVTLTLKGVSPDALAQWLAQVRLTAHAVPSEARLTRGASATGAAASAAPTWDGTLVLTLSAG
jgi:general secretion pathway protein M